MIEREIISNGQTEFIACDGECDKAWGINNRPRVQLSDDEDDCAFLADDELGVAPFNPGTYEGGDAKPQFMAMALNKWCYRECERCRSAVGRSPELPDFSKRLYNIPTSDPSLANKVPMNEKLLCLISMVQAFKAALVSQNIFFQTVGKNELVKNWDVETKAFFFTVEKDILHEAGLLANNSAYEKILAFAITEEMRNTPSEELGRFFF